MNEPRESPWDRRETGRLILSRPRAADLPDLVAMHTDPEVMATLGGLRSPDELDAMHQRLLTTWERDGFGWWVARNRADGRFVGRGGLRRVQTRCHWVRSGGSGRSHVLRRDPARCRAV